MLKRFTFFHATIAAFMIFFGLFTVIPARAEVSVEASLSHHSFPVDRAAQLSITISGSSSSATIQLPEVKNITFHSRGQSTQVNLVNGNYSSSLSRTYLVQAAEPGKYTIPPIQINDDGKTFSTKAINFEVIRAGTQGNSSTSNGKTTVNDIAFIRIEQSGNHFTGEMVPVTIKAYFSEQYRFSLIEREQPVLKGDGVVMSSLPEKPEQTRESLGGSQYNVISWKTALSGIKTGKHPISFTLNSSLLIARQRRSLSPFGGSSLFNDSLFNNFLGGSQRKPITLTSGELSFDVVPIPSENQPVDFSGAIGDFTMQVRVTPIKVDVGEPLTLAIDISGEGNFDRVNAPSFPKSPLWKTYDPTAEFSKQSSIFSGSKKFEQAVVAKSDKAQNIPSLSFSYFNPRKRKFITINSGEIPIEVQQSNQPVQKQPAVSAPQKQITTAPSPPVAEITGLAPIHLKTGSFYREIVPLFQKSWFIALSVFCFLILLILIFLRIRLNGINKHPEIRQRQRALQLLEKDLYSVEQAKTSGDSLVFLMACRTTIQNVLGFLWHTEPAAISLEDIRARLQNTSALITLFEAAGQAAYGGETLSARQMHDYSTTLKTELENLL